MSSIDNILSSLRKTLEEKKQPLNEHYEITSTWLAKELDIVRKLVQNDPRDMQAIEEKMIPDAVSSAASSANNSKKRKSPETASEFKLSPEQKRSSVDVKDLLAAAGLPADLNKLKKEQLLEELVKRGVTKYNMKNLKNDLIDALESAILLEKRNSFKVSQEEATSTYENMSPVNQQPFVAAVASVDEIEAPAAAAAVAVEAAPASAAKPARVRQGSLMAEFRKKVYNTSSQDADVDAKLKIENEFRNRQERHRDSIARKSQILEAPPAQEEAHEDAEEVIQSSSVPFASAAEEPEAQEAETAMDIASPIRETVRPAEPEEVEQPEETCDGANCDVAEEAVEAMDAAPEAPVVEESQPEAEAEAEADKEEDDISDIEEDASVTASVAADALQETSASALSQQSEASAFQQSSKSSLSSTNSGQSHASEPVKKPMNLVNLSNSASFLDKPSAKPMVPALAKAKLLKEQEELKEQKRKELKAAKAAGAMGGSKPAATVAASASETNTVRSPWGKMAKGIKNVAEDVKSKINLFNKKPATATEPVAAKAPTKQPFDVRATESKSSLSSAPPATPAAAPAPVAVAPVAVAPPAPVVEAPAAVIAAPPAPPAVEAAQSTSHALPPKSAIKEILKNYHEAVASPISTKPAPVISVASVTSPAAPLASLPMTAASVPAPVASAPIAAPVAPVVPPPAVATLQPAEPHVLREHVAAPAQPVAAAAPAQTAVVAAQEAEEEDDYDPANNYQIEDTPDSDDSDGGSGTDDEDESNKKKQQIPEWARGDALREALERQYGLNGHPLVDPDLIFPEVQSCSLEEIFGRKEGLSRKYSARTSSAHWDADELTLVEKRQYRVHMGYEQNPAASAGGRPVKLH